MNPNATLDEQLVQQLPLPLARMYRRAFNAKTPLERHHAAYYLWESSLKLLGAVAIASYAARDLRLPAVNELLKNLARPSTGHWWQIVRTLTPELVKAGDQSFVPIEHCLLGHSRDDMPRAAGLDSALRDALGTHSGARVTVQISELFDRLVRYRNVELGHGASGQRGREFYEAMGQSIVLGMAELLSRVDLLVGNRLVYLAEIRRQAHGDWNVERYELVGETPRRIESLDYPDSSVSSLPNPEQVYLQLAGADQSPVFRSLHPLVLYDANLDDVFFLNSRRGQTSTEYLCYSTGQVIRREDLGGAQRNLLEHLTGEAVDVERLGAWRQQTQAEEVGFPPEPAPAGQTIAEFELLSEIGRGGMGVVYRAWQPSLGRQVALKSLLKAGDPKAEARFAREIRALGRVEHPHLIKIFTSGAEGSQWFFTMEMIDGAPLGAICDRLREAQVRPADLTVDTWRNTLQQSRQELKAGEKPLAPPRTAPATSPQTPSSSSDMRVLSSQRGYVQHMAELIAQVAEAAHVLHEAGIVHRDIKPGNIIVTAHGEDAVLMDLGLAQIADDVQGRLTRTRQFVGTLRYASPEQVLAVSKVDRRSDIYSIGAALWELLTLQPIFEASDDVSTLELMRKIESVDPGPTRAFNANVSVDLDAIVSRCLEKNPSQRYATAAELAADLRRYLNGEPVTARPIGSLERSWRWIRRRPLQASLVAASLLAIVATVTATVFVQMRNREREFNQQLVAANQEIERQRQFAESNYRETLAALDRILNLTSSEELVAEPALQPLRLLLLNYYQEYVTRRKDDPTLQRDLAAAYERIATITRSIGRKDDSLRFYESAEIAYRRLIDAHSDDALLIDRLACVRINQGIVWQDSRKFSEALDHFSLARDALDALHRDHPEQASYTQHLAEAYHNLGMLDSDQNRRAESIAAFEQSLKLRQELVVKSPERGYRHDLARSFGYLGDMYLDAGQAVQALDAYRQAEHIRQELVDESPSDFEAQFQLARSFRNTGNYFDRQGDVPRAIQEYRKAREYALSLVERRPAMIEYRRDLADYCTNLAELTFDARLDAEINEPLSQAQSLAAALIYENPEDMTSRSLLLRCHVCRARMLAPHDREASDTELDAAHAMLQAAGSRNIAEDYLAAAIVEVLRTDVPDDVKLAAQPDYRERQARAAVHQLEFAIAAGYRNSAKLRRDAALQTLSSRDDFTRLLQSLETKAASRQEFLR